MKIGVYGGTFNPPHLGHIAAARTAMEILGLDVLYLVPSGSPPHKEIPSGSPSPVQRLEMTRLAGEYLNAGNRVQTLDMEMTAPGKSYTSHTIAALRERYPADSLWLLMGTDMFLTIHQWHETERILSCAGIAAFGRTEEDTEELFTRQREWLFHRYPEARIYTMNVPDVINISSTELRRRLANGEGGSYLPPAVYGYILREGLYNTRADLRHLPLSQLRSVGLSYLDHRRISHVLGTEQEAIRLCMRYGGDMETARRAALLHDCTKRLGFDEQIALCERYGIELDEMERSEGKLLHAKTGAVIAERIFGESSEVVSAIRWHTTGRADMTLPEKIMYLADYMEPSRDFPGVEELRRVCYEDLDKGLALGLEMGIQELTERGQPVHHATLQALRFLREQKS